MGSPRKKRVLQGARNERRRRHRHKHLSSVGPAKPTNTCVKIPPARPTHACRRIGARWAVGKHRAGVGATDREWG